MNVPTEHIDRLATAIKAAFGELVDSKITDISVAAADSGDDAITVSFSVKIDYTSANPKGEVTCSYARRTKDAVPFIVNQPELPL